MKNYKSMTREELAAEKDALTLRYEEYKAMSLALDMTRGKPSSEQLDLSNHMYDDLASTNFRNSLGQDVRNYGIPAGIVDARELLLRY